MKKIILVLSFFFIGLVSAQEVEANIDDIKEVAETGNVKAQFVLGTAYYLGLNGAEQDYEKAVYWFTKAAEQGNDIAQLGLGECYREGTGVEQSYSRSAYWYKKAAQQGNSSAQFNIGLYYHNGQGVEQSNSKAVYWLRKACDNFDDQACEILNKLK